MSVRRRIWYELVDSDVLALLERGDEDLAQRRVAQIVGFSPEVAHA